jgi:nucleoside transporter
MTDISQQTLSMPLSLRVRLSGIMFLQFMTMPVWFNTFIPYFQTLPGGERWTAWCGMLMGFGMLVSPVLCMFADRLFNAEKVLAACNFVCAALLGACYFTRSPAELFFLLLAVTLVYMPTWSLVSALAMANATPATFPHIRVFGSVGWICSAVFSVAGIKFLGIENFDKSPLIFAAAAGVSVTAGVLSLFLPATPPKGGDQPFSVADALGLKAFSLFRNKEFFVFGTILVLSMIPFQWYLSYNTMYLDEVGFRYLSLMQNLGQVGELALMLALPFIFRKCGYKWAMVGGIGALALRYAFFYAATAFKIPALDFAGILLHGVVFGMLIVGAQMYVDSIAPPELRNQAQGLVMTLTGGIGVFLSVNIFDSILKTHALPGGGHDWSFPFLVAFAVAFVLTVLMAVFFRPARTRSQSDQPAAAGD